MIIIIIFFLKHLCTQSNRHNYIGTDSSYLEIVIDVDERIIELHSTVQRHQIEIKFDFIRIFIYYLLFK